MVDRASRSPIENGKRTQIRTEIDGFGDHRVTITLFSYTLAVRVGFEPTKPKRLNGLANRRIRPTMLPNLIGGSDEI